MGTTRSAMMASAPKASAAARTKFPALNPCSAPKASAWVSASGAKINATLLRLAMPPCSAPWRLASVMRESSAFIDGKASAWNALTARMT